MPDKPYQLSQLAAPAVARHTNGTDLTASQTVKPTDTRQYKSYEDIFREQMPAMPQELQIDEPWERKHVNLYAVTDLVAGLGNVIAAAHGATPQQLTSATAANNARLQKLIEARRKYADSYRAGLVNAAYQDAQVQRQQAQQAQAQANWQQSFDAQERARQWQQANTEAQQAETNRRYNEQLAETRRHNKTLEGARTQSAGAQGSNGGSYEYYDVATPQGNQRVAVDMSYIASNITRIERWLENSSVAEQWSQDKAFDTLNHQSKDRYQIAVKWAMQDPEIAKALLGELGYTQSQDKPAFDYGNDKPAFDYGN